MSQDAGGKNGRLGSSPKSYLRYYNHFVKTKKKMIQLNARLLLKNATRNSVNRCIREPYAWWSTYIAFRWINVRGALRQLQLAEPSTRLQGVFISSNNLFLVLFHVFQSSFFLSNLVVFSSQSD